MFAGSARFVIDAGGRAGTSISVMYNIEAARSEPAPVKLTTNWQTLVTSK